MVLNTKVQDKSANQSVLNLKDVFQIKFFNKDDDYTEKLNIDKEKIANFLDQFNQESVLQDHNIMIVFKTLNVIFNNPKHS